MTMEDRNAGHLYRISGEYVAKDETFLIKHKKFAQQYNRIYHVRLERLRQFVYEQARKKWGPLGMPMEN